MTDLLVITATIAAPIVLGLLPRAVALLITYRPDPRPGTAEWKSQRWEDTATSKARAAGASH